MSSSPATDVEISRALNALVTTLNDHRTAAPDSALLQRIVTGALGGEQRLRVTPGVASAEIADTAGRVVARLRRREDRWLAERVGGPRSEAYIPSAPPAG